MRLITLAIVILCLPGLQACGGGNVGIQKDGTYLLTTSEQAMACDRLYKEIWGRIQIIKGLPERVRAERQKVASTALQAWWRALGSSSKSLPAFEEFDRERAHVEALQRSMQDKRCMAVDLERELGPTILELDALRES